VANKGGKQAMSMIGRWLEEHGNALDALVAKIGKETGRRTTVEAVACDMLDQALEVFLDLYEVETKEQSQVVYKPKVQDPSHNK
jgi:hypothetical protein